jgi:hypothetical protein
MISNGRCQSGGRIIGVKMSAFFKVWNDWRYCFMKTNGESLARRCVSTPSPRPSCTKSLPVAPASEAGQWDSPAVVFLCEHLTGGSLLRLFPHPADPIASSTLPRSSSPTTSPAASTTPLAPHRRLLPVGTRATAKVFPRWAPPSRPPLLGFLVVACRPRSSDHIPLVCSGSSPSLSRRWARHRAHSGHGRAWRLCAVHTLAAPSWCGSAKGRRPGLGAGPSTVRPLWPWAELRHVWIVSFLNFL